MCNGECDDIFNEECIYYKENCEYQCTLVSETDEYSYSSTQKLAGTSGLAAFLAAINF